MLLDAQNLFDFAAVLPVPGTGGALPNVISSNQIDVEPVGASQLAFLVGRDLAKGERVFLIMQVAAIVNAPTLSFMVVGYDDAAFTVNRLVLFDSRALSQYGPSYAPAANTMIRIGLTTNPQNPKRYYRIEYALGGGGGTAATQIFTIAAGANGTYTATIGGIQFTFQRTVSDAEAASNMANVINSNPQLSQYISAQANINAAKATAAGVVLITALATGTGPNAITTVANSGTGFTAGAATLAGGAGNAPSATVTSGFTKDEQDTWMT